MKSIGKTSTEAKNRWNAANYRRFTVSLSRDDDAEIIEFLDKAKADNRKIVSDVFRAGYDQIKKEGLK